MAGYLVYWKTYWSQTDAGFPPRAFWSTDSEVFHSKVHPGDRLWVVIPAPEPHPDQWRLLGKIWVRRRNPERSPSPWGDLHIEGDPDRSVFYDPSAQPDFTAVLLLLEFEGHTPIPVIGPQIGKSLQSHGHRTLTDRDIVLLEEYGKALERVLPTNP